MIDTLEKVYAKVPYKGEGYFYALIHFNLWSEKDKKSQWGWLKKGDGSAFTVDYNHSFKKDTKEPNVKLVLPFEFMFGEKYEEIQTLRDLSVY